MQHNENSTFNSFTDLINTTTRPSEERYVLDHWAFKFFSYFFGIAFGIFSLCCLVFIVRQCKQPSSSRSIHSRFTTVQLFVAAALKEVALFWSPLLLDGETTEIVLITLLVDCVSVALILTAFSILLLILLESTKISLAPPRLQNIWVLLGFTVVPTVIMLTFNLLVLYVREVWYLVSYVTILGWGIFICVGYLIAGRRMWRNLKSSRQLGTSSGDRKLRNITFLVFVAPWITAVFLILDVCLAASFYEMSSVAVTEKEIWERYTIAFLLQSCEFTIVLLIFGVVVRTKSGKGSVDNAPTVQLGTFFDEEPKTEN